MNLNHLVISGNLTRDPEMRTVANDKVITKFTIANNNKYKGANGEQREDVTFVDCDAWGRQGEIAAQYLQKGSPCVVEGGLRQDNWTDKDGQKRSKLVLRVDKVHLVGGRRDEGGGEAAGPGEADAAAPATNSQRPPARGPRAPLVPQPGVGGDDEPPF